MRRPGTKVGVAAMYGGGGETGYEGGKLRTWESSQNSRKVACLSENAGRES